MNPVIGDRSLGRDPELVGRLGAALARGLQSAGVAACAKHFPGHGDTSQDSHVDLPRLAHPLSRLEAIELAPFRALSRAGVASVMTAHVVFEALDPVRPATLSPPVMQLLRGACGFDGPANFPLEEVVPGAVAAGVDGLLVCHRADVQNRAVDLLRQAVERGSVSRERLAEARARIARLLSWASPPGDPALAASRLRLPDALALAARLPARAAGKDPTAA
jgi:beta-N-acetylhexosaminidase